MLTNIVLALTVLTQTDNSAPPIANSAPPKPPPYSLPFGLRPVVAVNVVRLDTVVAIAKPTTTIPVLALFSYKLSDQLAALIRLGVVQNSPEGADGAMGLTNAAVAGSYSLKLGDYRLNLFTGVTIPVGSGGGDSPTAATRAAVLAGIPARSAMDNAMFGMNYLTIFPGVGLAWVSSGLTVQAELTTLFLIRARGDAVDKDSFRFNLTSGLHVGYFVASALSVGAELRYQRWLVNDTVTKVDDNPAVDNLTVAFGPRVHVDLGDGMWLRPGLSFAVGLDDPMGLGDTGAEYKLLQVDLPFVF
ncbi:MAG: hypothetical protein HY795_18540 [Desulfovibrio sp.]|nr:hypothetical protein [Desulfovibrio sp.]